MIDVKSAKAYADRVKVVPYNIEEETFFGPLAAPNLIDGYTSGSNNNDTAKTTAPIIKAEKKEPLPVKEEEIAPLPVKTEEKTPPPIAPSKKVNYRERTGVVDPMDKDKEFDYKINRGDKLINIERQIILT